MNTHVAAEELPIRRRPDRTFWVGVFFLLGVTAALTLLFLGTNPGTFRQRYNLVGLTPDAAGLRKGDTVRMRGVNIGRVQGFGLQDDGVVLNLEIEGKYKIPSDSRFVLATSNIMGDTAVEIIPGESEEPLHSGQTLEGEASRDLIGKVRDVAGEASNTMERVQKLLSDQTVTNVEESTTQLNHLLTELTALISEEREQIQELTASLRRSAKGMERATGPELERSVQRLEVLTKRLEQASASVQRTARSAETVLGRIERGEGLLGKLSKDDALYNNANRAALNLGKAAADLSRLIEDVRRNPRRYINLEIF